VQLVHITTVSRYEVPLQKLSTRQHYVQHIPLPNNTLNRSIVNAQACDTYLVRKRKWKQWHHWKFCIILNHYVLLTNW